MIAATLKPYLLAGAVALVFGSGWQVRAWYDGAKDAAVLAAEKKTQDKLAELAGKVATTTETAIQGIKIENRTIYTTAAKEIIREPIYRDCVLPEPGRLRANEARRGATAGEPRDRVPAGPID
jgi:hypothetical protein